MATKKDSKTLKEEQTILKKTVKRAPKKSEKANLSVVKSDELVETKQDVAPVEDKKVDANQKIFEAMQKDMDMFKGKKIAFRIINEELEKVALEDSDPHDAIRVVMNLDIEVDYEGVTYRAKLVGLPPHINLPEDQMADYKKQLMEIISMDVYFSVLPLVLQKKLVGSDMVFTSKDIERIAAKHNPLK